MDVRLGLLVLVGVTTVGCNLDVCDEHPPAFELEITVDDEIVEPIRSFEVQVEWDENRFAQVYVVGDKLDDGLTSVGVELDPKPTDEIDLRIEVLGYAGEDSSSTLLAQERGRFEVAPNGCNLFSLQLDEIDDENRRR